MERSLGFQVDPAVTGTTHLDFEFLGQRRTVMKGQKPSFERRSDMSVSYLVVVFLLLMATQVQAQYIGCFRDEGVRDLSGYSTPIEGMTNAVCRQTCAAKGSQYSGTQLGNQCFCGDTYGKYGPSTNCNS